jgi:hypothetical protein
MRNVTDKIIEVAVSGEFWNTEKHTVPYRVKISLPDCLNEYLLTNIKNRYIFRAIKNGMEYSNGKEKENKEYYRVGKVKTYKIEFYDDNGESAVIVTDKTPSFYSKSIFKMSRNELQDFSVAFGLHKIPAAGDVEESRKIAFIEYLDKIKGINEEKLKTFSFYKYDTLRRKYYFEFTEEELENAKIHNHECHDLKEFAENDEKIASGKQSVLDLFGTKENKSPAMNPDRSNDSPDASKAKPRDNAASNGNNANNANNANTVGLFSNNSIGDVNIIK